MAADAQSTRSPKPEPTWELVLKRNPVERLKQEKAPLGIRDELPALIAAGYESVAEEDIVRLQWWGLYHDKPKIGTFMLRVKLPSGHLTPAKLRAIGEVSNTFGRGDGELATRQNIQLHWLELARLPDVFAHLDAAGITTAGGCGDTVRNITGCPVQGLDPDELFDCEPGRRGGGRVLLRQPRLLRPAAEAQVHDRRLLRPLQRARDQLHRARRRHPRGPRGLRRPRRRRPLLGAADLARHGRLRPEGGGGRDPRRDHGRLVGRPPLPRLAGQGAPQVHDRRHRARGHARARRGAARAHARGLRAAARHHGALRPPRHPRAEAARPRLHRRPRPPRAHLGRPDDRGRRASPSASAADIRVTRLQNFVVANVPEAEADERRRRARRDRLPARRQPGARPLDRVHRRAALQLLGHGDEDAARPPDRAPRGALRRPASPTSACTSTAARTRARSTGSATSASRGRPPATREGARRQAYDIFVRGGLGLDAAIGRPLFRRVPTEELDAGGRRARRTAGSTAARPAESFAAFATRLSDDELGVLAGVEPARSESGAKARSEEEAA